MWLVSLDLTNYRAFPDAHFEMTSPGITFVAGPNNSGKTALLSAIDYVATSEAMNGLRYGSLEAAVTATFQFTDVERLPLLRAVAGSETGAEPWIKTEALRKVAYGFRQPANLGKSFLVSVEVSMSDGRMVGVLKRQDVASETWDLSSLTGWLGGRVDADPVKTSTHHAGNDPRPLFEGRMSSGYEELAVLFKKWSQNVYHFRALRPGTGDRQEIRVMDGRLEPTGTNLAQVLAWLRANRDSEWGSLTRVIADLVPEIGQLRAPLEGGYVWVEFEGPDGFRHNLKSLGTGVEQLLLTAYVGVCDPDASLVVIEEPETNLHPDAQRALLGYLRTWGTQRQIVCATHSTVFLDRASEIETVWTVTRSEGVSRVAPAESDAELLAVLGLRPSDLLSAVGLALVEGPSDEDAIEFWFGDKLRTNRIRIANSGGGDASWNVRSIERWMDAVAAIKRPALFIRDRDEMSDATVARLTSTGNVHVLARRELENYFLDGALIANALDDALERRGKLPIQWNPADVGDQLRRGARSLQSMVVLKRVAERLKEVRALPRNSVEEAIKTGINLKNVSRIVRRNVKGGAAVDEIWRSAKAEVLAGWDDNWIAWVEGSEVLDLVWKAAGIRFDKNEDTAAIAAMTQPPDELINAIDALIEKVRT